MKIAIVGASGFVGTNMVLAAKDIGHDVIAGVHKNDLKVDFEGVDIRECDLSQPDLMSNFFRDADWAINCAGAVSAASVTVNSPLNPIFQNLYLNTQFIEACVNNNVQRMLTFGSSTGYPPLSIPVNEDMMFSGEPAPVYEGYGRMRRYIERLSMFASAKSNTAACIVRPSAVYGPFDDFGDGTSHVIPALIKRAIAREVPYVVWGNGNEVRDFMYIEDFCKGCLLAIDKYCAGKPINIARGTGITIAEVVSTIFEILGLDKNSITFDETKPTTIPIRLVDTTLAKSILTGLNQTSFFEGMRNTIQSYQQKV
jgi:GDP-L-fucose synthase